MTGVLHLSMNIKCTPREGRKGMGGGTRAHWLFPSNLDVIVALTATIEY